MKIPARMWPGIEFVLLGLIVCCGTEYWYQTRIYTALDTPIVLHHGHVVTPEFEINLSHDYLASITTDDRLYFPGGPCPDFSAMRSEVALERNGKTVPDSSPMTPQVMTAYYDPAYHQFHADGGRYRLDFNFLGDPSCANSKNTRLIVEIVPWDADHVAALRASIDFFVILAMVVGGVVLFGAYAHPFEPPIRLVSFVSALAAGSTSHRVSSETYEEQRSDIGNRLLGWSPLQALRARRWAGFSVRPWEGGSTAQFPVVVRNPATALPTVALSCCLFLFVIFAPWVMATGMRQRTIGLMVRVMGPRTVVSSDLAGETISIWIDVQNRWYLNSKPVTPAELPLKLQGMLARQPHWIVYLGADSNVDFGEVMRVVDLIRRQHAQVILLTNDAESSATARPNRIK